MVVKQGHYLIRQKFVGDNYCHQQNFRRFCPTILSDNVYLELCSCIIHAPTGFWIKTNNDAAETSSHDVSFRTLVKI